MEAEKGMENKGKLGWLKIGTFQDKVMSCSENISLVALSIVKLCFGKGISQRTKFVKPEF